MQNQMGWQYPQVLQDGTGLSFNVCLLKIALQISSKLCQCARTYQFYRLADRRRQGLF
jgi:hypothetical protein